MSLFNQFSALWGFLLPVTLLLIALNTRRYPAIRRYSFIVGVLLAAVLVLFLLGSRVEGNSVTEVETILGGNGRPVLLELYSNY